MNTTFFVIQNFTFFSWNHKESSDEKFDHNESSFLGGETLNNDGTRTTDGQKKIDESYPNIPVCETGNYTTYSTIIPGTSQQDTNDSLTNTKRLLEHTSKESYSHDGMSPNFVDTLIKGENPFDDQITKFCEGQAFPSLRIEQQTGTKGKDTTIKFDTSKGNNRLLVKDEFLAAVRDDLAEEYSPLYKETPSRITEAGRKYLAERVASATTDAAAAAERHWRFNNTKIPM